MPEVEVNGQPVEAHEGELVIDLLHRLDIEVPHFCYHPELSLAGACRMCMVEMDGNVDVSCTRRVEEDMEIVSDSEEVVETRRGILEFLLVNHPLDCPVCDKGGECPLQDYTMGYGPAESRFHGNKRTFPKLDLGELLTQRQNRCILCYRCTRFYHEEAGREDFRVIERGDEAFVGKQPGGQLESELSGNMVDICPTGTIVTKPYLHKSRPWDNEPRDTVSAFDPLQTPITVDVRGNEIVRVRPQEEPDYPKPWIDDRVRFAHEYNHVDNRVDLPRDETFFDRFDRTMEELDSADNPAGIISPDRTLEEQMLFRELLEEQDGEATSLLDTGGVVVDAPRLEEIPEADFVLVVGTNFRNEYPMLTPFLREAGRNGARVAYLSYWGDELTVEPDIYLKERPEDLLKRLRRLSAGDSDDPTDEAIHEELEASDNTIIVTCEGRAMGPSLCQQVQRWMPEDSQHLRLSPGGNSRASERVFQSSPSVGRMLEECAEGDRDTLMVYGVDLLRQHPDRSLVRRVLDSIETLIVVDYLEGQLTERADLVLPLTTQFEEPGILISAEGRIRWSPSVVEHDKRTLAGWEMLSFGMFDEDEVAGMSREDLGRWVTDREESLPQNLGTVVETEQSLWLEHGYAEPGEEPPRELTETRGAWTVFSENYLYSSDRRCQEGESLQGMLQAPVMECNRADAEKLGADRETELVVEVDGEAIERPVTITNNPPEGSLLIPWNVRGDAGLELYEGNVSFRRIKTIEPIEAQAAEA